MSTIGFMYVGKKECGRVAALCWDDPKYRKDTAKTLADWIMRGLLVERIERKAGDSKLELICDECRGKPCRAAATPQEEQGR